MDSLDSTSVSNGSATVNLGSDLGPLGDAASSSAADAWNQAMGSAGLSPGSSGGDGGWGSPSTDTGSTLDFTVTVPAEALNQDDASAVSDKRDETSSTQAPPATGSNGGGDSPGPIASAFRYLFGHVDPSQWAAIGAKAGGIGGGIVGGAVGGTGEGIAGAGVGTLALPGGGTVAGGLMGAADGALNGAAVGGALGTAAGGLIGKTAGEFITYMESNEGSGGSEGTQNTPQTTAGAAGGPDFAPESGVLRSAAQGKGNFGLGNATAQASERLGRAWVGNNPTLASDGRTLVSQDGLRQYRPPSFKPNLDRVQANFEQRSVPNGQWQSNGHLDITK